MLDPTRMRIAGTIRPFDRKFSGGVHAFGDKISTMELPPDLVHKPPQNKKSTGEDPLFKQIDDALERRRNS